MPPSLSPESAALEAQLLLEAQAIAARIIPPFTAAKRAELANALAASALTRHRLWQICAVAAQAPRPVLSSLPTLHGINRNLALWSQTAEHVQSLRPLNNPTPDAQNAALLLAYERAFYHLHSHLSVGSVEESYHRDNGRHADIPLPFTRFQALVQLSRRLARAAGRVGPLAFLDVGSGVGLKVLQAAQVFERAEGLEYDAARAEAAAAMLLGSGAVSHTGDALNYDDYGRFDVIYAYRPLADDILMQEAEARILSQVKPGTVMIMPYSHFEGRHAGYGCTQIDGPIYLAGLTKAEANRAQRLLPHIGPCLTNRGGQDEGFVAPIRNALRHWGHLG